MKYQVVELSIRKYLGVYTNKTEWEHIRYAIGIKKDNEVYDYKTLEKYNFIDRNNEGILNVSISELVKGKIYALGGKSLTFDSDKEYSERFIEKGIEQSFLYSDKYKKIKRKIK